MTGQEQAIVLCLKIGLVCGFASIVGWVAVYIALTRGAALKNPVGLTLIIKSLLIAGLFIPTILSLFFHLSRMDSLIAGWADVALIGLVTPVMTWRTWVWIRMARLGRLPSHDDEGGSPDGAA